VQDAHDRCMKRNTDAAAATPHSWWFDKVTCECKEEPISEPMCPGSSGLTVQDAHDRCMKHNTDAAAATPHSWTFDKATCECKEEPIDCAGIICEACPDLMVPDPDGGCCACKRAPLCPDGRWSIEEAKANCEGERGMFDAESCDCKFRVVRCPDGRPYDEAKALCVGDKNGRFDPDTCECDGVVAPEPMCPGSSGLTVQDAHDRCMKRNTDAAAATRRSWWFDKVSCECKEEPIPEPMCPGSSGLTVQDAHDRCMKRNTDAAAAAPHGWTFDKSTCDCKPGLPLVCTSICPASHVVLEFQDPVPHDGPSLRNDMTCGELDVFHRVHPDPYGRSCDEIQAMALGSGCCKAAKPNEPVEPEPPTDEEKQARKQAREQQRERRAKMQAKRAARKQAKELLKRLSIEGGIASLHREADVDENGGLSVEEFAEALGLDLPVE